jgi:hypothetical protein
MFHQDYLRLSLCFWLKLVMLRANTTKTCARVLQSLLKSDFFTAISLIKVLINLYNAGHQLMLHLGSLV